MPNRSLRSLYLVFCELVVMCTERDAKEKRIALKKKIQWFSKSDKNKYVIFIQKRKSLELLNCFKFCTKCIILYAAKSQCIFYLLYITGLNVNIISQMFTKLE